MHLWPFFRELLPGPLGAGLLGWIVLVVWLAGTGRNRGLGIVHALTAALLALAAFEAFDHSSRPSPNRDMPLILSGLFVTFGFGALICATMAIATAAPAVRARFGRGGRSDGPENGLRKRASDRYESK